MRSVNKVILVGNLTRDPELKQTQSGQAICTFGMATNREWSGTDGERHSLAEFHEVVAWARRAEVCHQILKKGNLVYVEGYIKTRSWDDEDGKKRFRTEVVIDDIIKLEKRKLDDSAPESVPAKPENATGELGAAAAGAFSAADEKKVAPETTAPAAAPKTENETPTF